MVVPDQNEFIYKNLELTREAPRKVQGFFIDKNMAAELPYFRFTVSEWLNGDISMEDMFTRGLFIDICAWYWFKDCSVTKAMLEKKFHEYKNYINDLMESDIIKEDGEHIQIDFLNDQFDILSEKRKKRQAAGSKGGKQKSSNAKAMPKQKPSYKDKDKYKDKENNKDNSRARKCLMKNSNTNIPLVVEAFQKTDDLKNADAKYYYNICLDWSDSKDEMRTDWVATVRGFARRDLKDGKLKLSAFAQDGGSNLSIKEPKAEPVESKTAITRDQWKQSDEYKQKFN